MKLFFFTYVDDNPKYRRDAEILIASGKKYGRKIHLFEVPKGELWNRYKVRLIASDLPAADRYVCLDSDTVLTGPGDWDATECQGVSDVLYFCPNERIKHTNGFVRNHTLLTGDPGVCDFIFQQWRKMYCPIWCNSGVVVLDACHRLPFARLWMSWMALCDQHSDKGGIVGDEAPCMFARHEYGLPFLPQRFNGLCKWQPIYPWHCLIHADGNVTGEKKKPYDNAVKKALQ